MDWTIILLTVVIVSVIVGVIIRARNQQQSDLTEEQATTDLIVAEQTFTAGEASARKSQPHQLRSPVKLDIDRLRGMKQQVAAIAPPLCTARPDIRDPQGFIEAELIMVALHMTNADEDSAQSEMDMVNQVRRAIGTSAAHPIQATSRVETFRTFLRLYPQCSTSIDHLPATIRILDEFDSAHNAHYGGDARKLFSDFANAVMLADGQTHGFERIVLENFVAMLDEPASVS